MKHKVSELDGALLDAAVAKAEGYDLSDPADFQRAPGGGGWRLDEFRPSQRWVQAGPIIDREHITIGSPGFMLSGQWEAFIDAKLIDLPSGLPDLVGKFEGHGLTPIKAAMRAYVASKFGEHVELPTSSYH